MPATPSAQHLAERTTAESLAHETHPPPIRIQCSTRHHKQKEKRGRERYEDWVRMIVRRSAVTPRRERFTNVLQKYRKSMLTLLGTAHEDYSFPHGRDVDTRYRTLFFRFSGDEHVKRSRWHRIRTRIGETNEHKIVQKYKQVKLSAFRARTSPSSRPRLRTIARTPYPTSCTRYRAKSSTFT